MIVRKFKELMAFHLRKVKFLIKDKIINNYTREKLKGQHMSKYILYKRLINSFTPK